MWPDGLMIQSVGLKSRAFRSAVGSLAKLFTRQAVEIGQ